MVYYSAFFVNYRPFLYEKLKSFTSEKKSNIWIYKDKNSTFFQNGLPQDIYPPVEWYLHGSHLGSKKNSISLPLLKGTKLEEINTTFQVLSTKYSWSILPWGSIYSHDLLSSFVFISRKEMTFNKFLETYHNTVNVKSHYGHIISQCNLLVSSYKVQTNFSEYVQGILIEDDFDYPGSLIWDACQLDSYPPLLISEVYCSDKTDDFYEIEDPDPDSPIYWERVNYKPLRIIDVQLKEKSTNFHTDNNKKFGVYQPQDKQSFINMCMSLRQGTETLIFVPHNTNIDKLSKLLSIIEASDYSKYSDLSYIQDILQTTEWFYGLDRNYVDVGDNMYSLFISKDNKLIQKIDSMNTDYKNKLISFF